MVYKKYFLPFLLFLIFIIICSNSLSFAQYTTYYPTINYQTGALSYPNYQNNIYSAYQTSSYWPNLAGNYIDPYNQSILYNTNAGSYLPTLTNSYNPYTPYASQALNQGNLLYNYNPYGTSYTSSLFNPYGSLGFPLNSAGIYYPGTYSANNTITDTNSVTNSNYISQASSFYPAIYPGLSTGLQINPYALSSLSLSNLYSNPFSNYIANQNYYQNPYISYPYNYNLGQTNTVNPYQYPYGYTIDPYTGYPIYTYNQSNAYNQTNSYNQPLPYYQTNSTTTYNQDNLINTNGSWSGTWFTTLADGTVNNGDATLSLTQNGTVISGTISFALNSYQKLSTNVNGTITGSNLTLTGSLLNGTDIYKLSVNGNVSGNNLSGTYSINLNNGPVVESGTYNIAHL